MSTVISIENVSKSYQLGAINTGTFYGDLNRWWAKLRGLPDPHLKIGEMDHGNRDGETIWALKDINFQVQQGEALGIIGRNGAGKSTLLKILSRVTAPSSGEVKVKGRIASLLEVGTGFHPELSGRENIYLNGTILGMRKSEIARRFDEIVNFSGVEKYIDTPVKRYSSGMYVRLAFAVAAHLEPEILIVDEVLAVGDAEFQKKCLGKMGEAAQGGRTVLFVSHNLSAITRLCTRSILLTQGIVTADGPSDETVAIYYDSLRKSDERDGFGNRIVNSDVGFVNWSIGDFRDIPVHQVYSDGPVEIRFLIEAKRAVQGVSFGIAILTTNEQVIWALSTKNYESGKFDLQQGRHVLSFKLPAFPVRPGDYQLTVSASGSQEGPLDEWSDMLVVLAENGTRVSEKWRGILNVSGTFTMDRY